MSEPKTTYLVHYRKRGMKLLRILTEHPIPDDLFAQLKSGRWKKITVETWREDGNDDYSLLFTMAVFKKPSSAGRPS